jgi:hypothetical protein
VGGTTAVAAQESKEPPHEFLCPISMELMTDPVVLVETKQTYDRASIAHWFALGNKTDPLTNLPLESPAMEPDRALRVKIEAWQARQRVGGGIW